MKSLRSTAIIYIATLLAVSMSSQAADEPTARERLKACSNTTDADVTGLEELEKSCPGLKDALAEYGVADTLCDSCRDQLDIHALDQLVALQDRFQQAQSTVSPDPGSVRSIVSEMTIQTDTKMSWWDRFKNWLRDSLGGKSGQMPAWLDQLAERLSVSEALLKVLLYALVAALVGIAVGAIVNEMRAAGLFTRFGVPPKEAPSKQLLPKGDRALTLSDVDAAPEPQRPALMLRLIAGTLVATQKLRSEKNLTHRELVRAVQFGDVTDRECFERLALLAERIRYGSGANFADSVATYSKRIVGEAQQLYSQLTVHPRS